MNILRRLKSFFLVLFLYVPFIKRVGHFYKYEVKNKDYDRDNRINIDNSPLIHDTLCENCLDNIRNEFFLRKYSDCYIIPNTDALIYGSFLLSNRFSLDKNAIVSIGEPVVKYNEKRVIIKASAVVKLDGVYINLCFDGAKNIWHLTFDMLSKFSIINNISDLKGIPLLVDERIKSFEFAQEYLKTLNVDKHVITYVEPNTLYLTETVIELPSSYLFIRGNNAKNDMFWVNTSFIPYFRSCILENVKDLGYRKVYIRRGDGRLSNEEKIEKYLCLKGFKIVSPEKFSFYDELGIFAFSDFIIGSIGAAFTNIIYCKEGANIICIGPEERKGLTDAYNKICMSIETNFYYISSKIISDNHTGTPGMKFDGSIEEIAHLLDRLN